MIGITSGSDRPVGHGDLSGESDLYACWDPGRDPDKPGQTLGYWLIGVNRLSICLYGPVWWQVGCVV